MKSRLLIAILAFAPFIASAQFTGPKATNKSYSVKELIAESKSLTKEKKTVTTLGYVTEQVVGRHLYMFKDESGEIKINIEPDNLPNRAFDDKDKVLLIGVMKSKKEPLFIVSKTIVLNIPEEPVQPETSVAPVVPMEEDAEEVVEEDTEEAVELEDLSDVEAPEVEVAPAAAE
ncbi:MAG: NirD/YgiW/YdeI family stress tolerance protein [Reichenbachiella sp.]